MIDYTKLNEQTVKTLEAIVHSNDLRLHELRQWMTSFEAKEKGFHKSRNIKMFVGKDLNDGFADGKLIPSIKVEEMSQQQFRVIFMLNGDGKCHDNSQIKVLSVDKGHAMLFEKNGIKEKQCVFKLKGKNISKVKEIQQKQEKYIGI